MRDLAIGLGVVLWLTPLACAMADGMAWFLFGAPFTGVQWTEGRIAFAAIWTVAPPVAWFTWELA